jgi:hypothetical protein
MLAGNGVSPPIDAQGNVETIDVGPATVLFAPPMAGQTSGYPEWKFVEPTAASIRALEDRIERLETQMSKIGMAPLIRNTGGLTATAEAVNSAKSHAAAEAWASDEKDALEQGFAFTAMWLGENQKEAPQVFIHTDFGVELRENAENSELLGAAQNRAISRKTLWDEWQRRGFLGPQFDPDEEEKRLDQEKADGIAIGMRVPEGNGGAVASPRPAKARKVGGNRFDENPSRADPEAQTTINNRKDSALARA